MGDPKGTALVTGASSGLGLEIAKLFAADGHDVILVARRQDRLETLANELSEAHGITARPLAVDLSDPGAGDAIDEALGDTAVDYLVNNAGFGSNGRFQTLDRAKELRQVQVNVAALTDLSHRFLGRMLERGRGRILNIASTAAFQPGPLMSVYYATKAYVLSFTEGLAGEVASTPVTVTCHCPGATATEFAEAAGNDQTLLFRMAVARADAVAKHAYVSMMKGRVIAIPGVLNWLGAFLVRFSPRLVLRRLTKMLNKAS